MQVWQSKIQYTILYYGSQLGGFTLYNSGKLVGHVLHKYAFKAL